jgi:hypothetical protein
MKKNCLFTLAVFVLFLTFSCSEKWDAHYDQKETVIDGDAVKVVDSSAKEYIQSESDLSAVSALFAEQGIFEAMDSKDQLFTVLVYPNEVMSAATIDDPEFFAQTCVCDLAFTPTKLTNGLSMQMWNGKYLTVSVTEGSSGDEVRIAGSKVKGVVQVSDGFIYLLDAPVYAPKSLYEMLNDLDDHYSLFRELIASYEEKVFDKENSIPRGVDETGNTVYDSVFVVKNTLMDRYNSGGTETWNMRSEYYNSTMLIPSNDLITNALENAYDYIREALNREPTESDSTKFQEWIVKVSFYDDVLTPAELDGETDLTSVSGYQEDATASTSGVIWKPTVQKVNTANPVELSNGVAYYVTSLKIPNNVVIYRIKSRFYFWENCSEAEKAEYFKWTNLENPDIYDNGSFGPIGPWPAVYYKCLRAYPTEEATASKLPVALEYTGIALNDDGTVSVVMVPPGEYCLRMGFRSDKYPWRLDIYFNDELVAGNVDPNSGHYDRYGVGYPEGYNYNDWYSTNSKASNYDRDGFDVATVTVTGTEPRPIKIKMVSNNMTEGSGSKYRMIVYCWTLRPTDNNY